jgi:large subunit ribosomal protein L6
MSRIGNQPITIPTEAKVTIGDVRLQVEGPKGKLECVIPSGVKFHFGEGVLTASRSSDEDAAVHGLARSLAANAVMGVTQGFARHLEIVGVGYRAQVTGRVVVFSLGYSHLIEFLMPEGIEIKVEKQTAIAVSGIDKQLVCQTAAKIRALRPPDPYKNKGIRYAGERLRKKEGKASAKAA